MPCPFQGGTPVTGPRSGWEVPPRQGTPFWDGVPSPGQDGGIPPGQDGGTSSWKGLPPSDKLCLDRLYRRRYASCRLHALSCYENVCSSKKMQNNLKDLPKLKWQYVALEDNYLISYPASKICWSTFKPRHRYKKITRRTNDLKKENCSMVLQRILVDRSPNFLLNG